LLKRPTAVKLLKLHRATDELVARFEREVEIASRLTHPNTIEIFDFGRAPEGTPYYAMEYVEGIHFADLVERFGAQAPSRVACLLRQVCGSLKEAHELGLVHRDIKPHNLMLCRRGGELDVVKVLDFGLVKDTTVRDTRALTKSLRILGTPLYMSPERIRDASAADARDDIYAVGAVGYLLLTAGRCSKATAIWIPPPRCSIRRRSARRVFRPDYPGRTGPCDLPLSCQSARRSSADDRRADSHFRCRHGSSPVARGGGAGVVGEAWRRGAAR